MILLLIHTRNHDFPSDPIPDMKTLNSCLICHFLCVFPLKLPNLDCF